MKKLAIYFIVLNLIWSITALIVDFRVIANIPFYYWPFTIICPLFPFLIAIIWFKIFKGGKLQGFWLSLASIPSIAYFIGSLLYYPYWMIQNGFNIYAFGQIFWVAFYGLQGFWFYWKHKTSPRNDCMALSYLVISFWIQYFGKTFGYFDTSNISDFSTAVIYVLIVIATLAVLIAQKIFSTPSLLFSGK